MGQSEKERTKLVLIKLFQMHRLFLNAGRDIQPLPTLLLASCQHRNSAHFRWHQHRIHD
ncbi:uncharacterized protein EI90DRAFT_3071457 [Cantharellus anzutake]|uniref:uncharacterized protein n=1 Tax=Cantharellus anzutake TaxID=1750568 RepID=UPI001908E7D6|nr:uncharacterized protein EI90DRAFT_3071457 [Cantharellus anzutake]KAF8326089.1 hypothetical protein EI90DRAFT_3071457 [Cantharellus anzutake]